MADHATTLANLRAAVAAFVAERHWQVYHTPKSLSMAIAIEAAELMELFQWHGNQQSRLAARDADKRVAAAGELADVLIYCLALANELQLDVEETVMDKLVTNEQRFPPGQLPSRHKDIEKEHAG